MERPTKENTKYGRTCYGYFTLHSFHHFDLLYFEFTGADSTLLHPK